tara:strand:- start:1069 stop:1473 length:405 start_codon:yes stop_codon:yes gene_type:complete
MLTLKTNNREVVELMNGLYNVQNLEGKAFGLAVSKNIKIVQNELQELEKASNPSEEFLVLSKQAILVKDDEAAIKALEDENPLVVQDRKDQLDMLDKMLEEEIEISLHTIEENTLPNNITASQIASLGVLVVVG